jgi:nucleoporin NUP159
VELGKSAGGSRRAVDLGDRSKWALGDVVQFGQTVRMFEQDLAQLKEERAQREKLLRELQSNLLKGMSSFLAFVTLILTGHSGYSKGRDRKVHQGAT